MLRPQFDNHEEFIRFTMNLNYDDFLFLHSRNIQ